MPELPEVETIMNGLRPVWEGHIFRKIHVNRPDLRRPFPPGMKDILEGSKILHLSRRAKYILCTLETNHPVTMDSKSRELTQKPIRQWTLILHLGMSGRLLIDPAQEIPPRKHEHLVFITDQNRRVAFIDPRRFGMVDLIPTEMVKNYPSFASLGLEPLDRGKFTRQAFSHALLKDSHKSGKVQISQKISIKMALLDQKRIVGLGNIYVCELLFRAGISPLTTLAALSEENIETLWRLIPEILHQAINAGGSTLRDYVQTDGQKGRFQTLHLVYGREGKPCPDCPNQTKTGDVKNGSTGTKQIEKCGGIRRITQNGRSTFFCPMKQPENREQPENL